MSEVKVNIQGQNVNVSIHGQRAKIDFGTPVARDYVDAPAYAGPYTVTPTQGTQTLSTTGKRMTSNVTINPIPSNYGKITWDGSVLTVT